jgi:hypothetical protein
MTLYDDGEQPEVRGVMRMAWMDFYVSRNDHSISDESIFLISDSDLHDHPRSRPYGPGARSAHN